jgi:hypothetical protein
MYTSNMRIEANRFPGAFPNMGGFKQQYTQQPYIKMEQSYIKQEAYPVKEEISFIKQEYQEAVEETCENQVQKDEEPPKPLNEQAREYLSFELGKFDSRQVRANPQYEPMGQWVTACHLQETIF